jgi:hypothetical protein
MMPMLRSRIGKMSIWATICKRVPQFHSLFLTCRLVNWSSCSDIGRLTVGAGDIFKGAFTVAYASGMPLEEATHFANAAGALATLGVGAQHSIPGRDAILALVGRGTSDAG